MQTVHTELVEHDRQLLGHPRIQALVVALRLYPYGQVKHWDKLPWAQVRQLELAVHLTHWLLMRKASLKHDKHEDTLETEHVRQGYWQGWQVLSACNANPSKHDMHLPGLWFEHFLQPASHKAGTVWPLILMAIWPVDYLYDVHPLVPHWAQLAGQATHWKLDK